VEVRLRRACALAAMGLLLAIILSGCSAESAAPIQLTAKDDGSTQIVAVGREIEITLESNPTTGYTWNLDGPLPAQLEQVGAAEYTSESTALGGGGSEVWTFKAVSAGEGELSLKYARSFEPTASPAETFQITVLVQ
jgi:inhibitor of cysteine peptidase